MLVPIRKPTEQTQAEIWRGIADRLAAERRNLSFQNARLAIQLDQLRRGITERTKRDYNPKRHD